MSRTPGAKDKKPRRMVNAFPRKHADGSITAVVRVYAPVGDVRWFEELSTHERGKVITRVHREVEG